MLTCVGCSFSLSRAQDIARRYNHPLHRTRLDSSGPFFVVWREV